MNFRKTMCVFAVAAVVAFVPRAVKAGTIEYHDANGNLLPNPPAREDGLVGTKAEGFKLSLQTEATKYEINQSVALTVKFTNIDREGTAVTGLKPLEYKLEIQRPDGTLAPVTLDGEKAIHRAKMFVGGDTGPRSSGAYVEILLTRVDAYFDMRQIGQYQVRVLKEVPSRANPKKKVTFASNIVTFSIEMPKSEDDTMTTTATQAATDETAAP